ncbi:conserved hypothetical protein [Dethiosulfovibrio peptidovorans DSM 11002]|uniref:CRISPR-associated protein, Csh1 family n=1 Tax=Dethiosulfovibrio peptidovorans DSM 11002 TaxID=469381 RepID=D2Z4J2_9BACT|nr:conserved hypothetical protein [Dethiosulfovibrio peptidovorans DSM 11002]
MGFVDAVRDLGLLASGSSTGEGLDSFLQLPLPIIDDEDRRGKVIRVWMRASDPDGDVLELEGISRIDLVDYMSGEGGLDDHKRKYLYRDPVGSNTTWGFSPIYKLGAPKGDLEARVVALVGIADDDGFLRWREDKDTRFFKLEKRVLGDYQLSGRFTQGSLDGILRDLESKVHEIAELWEDKKRSYILMFGLEKNGKYLYPGEANAFKGYFEDKFSKVSGDSGKAGKGKGEVRCSMCDQKGSSSVNLDKIFAFATFDKASFLPGLDKKSESKVFPICQGCFAALSSGREILDRAFTDRQTVRGLNLYVVPELTLGSDKLAMASEHTADFVRDGLKVEDKVFRRLARQDDSLVLHFLFWEKNQAQEILHLMVEDVPPSRLKRLEDLWIESYRHFLWNYMEKPVFDPKEIDLDVGLKVIYQVMTSLSGKNEQDKKVMVSRILDLLGRLLSGELVDVTGVKQLMVSRLYGLCSNPEWIRYGGSEMRKMSAVIDFLIRANRR